MWKYAALLLSATMMATGCVTVTAPPDRGAALGYSRNERMQGTKVAMASPAGMALHTVTNGTVQVDAFESLLLLAGLDSTHDLPLRGVPFTPQEAAQVLAVLLRKPVTLASFPPRMAVSYLLREALEDGEVSREELLRRVERFNSVAVLRPDGYLAWTRNGSTQPARYLGRGQRDHAHADGRAGERGGHRAGAVPVSRRPARRGARRRARGEGGHGAERWSRGGHHPPAGQRKWAGAVASQ